ncbi:hypothetical protein H4P12_16200 [Paracoccus sp. 11-3]|uniref:DUF726 domain-containing protein n=1 Tax=Paracoccus amoyensis TaxID=2760093 RepID=A0A926GJT3_9RHOB|nr:hypothetical protein [Paracoccus amoyensis]MBC9248217.1 hypothetical protein [Paracoccus amoyensis]
MPIIKVNPDQTSPGDAYRLAKSLPDSAPIIAMIHGYRYSPHIPHHDPHRHILALDPLQDVPRVLSWPRALGFGGEDMSEGLAIAFGWEARGRLGTAFARAAGAGNWLGGYLSDIADAAGRPVSIIGHSMGARVALKSLHHTTPGSIGRIILLAGAEFEDEAAQALHTPAGKLAEVINVTSRENDLFDFGIELWLGRGRKRALGFGLKQPALNWVDLQIDCPENLKELGRMGFDIDRAPLRLSHSSPYLRRGMFDFYRTALRQPWALPLPMLRHRLSGQITPRWSRLLAPPAQIGGLRA